MSRGIARCAGEAAVRTTERWAPVPGYEGYYEVSDLGRVRSLDREVTTKTGGSKSLRGRYLSSRTRLDKYPSVKLYGPAARKRRHIHRLVMAAFVGPAPEGHEVRHLNGDRHDARLENLAYGTPSENHYDTVRHGNHHLAKKTGCIRGHAYTPENTYHKPEGGRECRKCRRDYMRRLKARRRQEAAA